MRKRSGRLVLCVIVAALILPVSGVEGSGFLASEPAESRPADLWARLEASVGGVGGMSIPINDTIPLRGLVVGESVLSLPDHGEILLPTVDSVLKRATTPEEERELLVVDVGVPVGELLPEDMLRAKDRVVIPADAPVDVAIVAGPLADIPGEQGLRDLAKTASCGGAGYYLVRLTLSEPLVTTTQVGPYGSTGSTYFGSSSCSLPVDDPFPQLWQPYNYGTAVMDPNPPPTPLWGTTCQLNLARDIGAAIDIKMDGATVYRAWGTDLDGGVNFHRPIIVTVTDNPTGYFWVHDDGDCVFLENGVTDDYPLFGVWVPDRQVELDVTTSFANLLQQRNAVAVDPQDAVDRASQWMGVAGSLIESGMPFDLRMTFVEYLLASLTDADTASTTMGLYGLYEMMTGNAMLSLVMTSWLGDLYDSVAYIRSIDNAKRQTTQAYFAASMATAISGAADLLKEAKPLGTINPSPANGFVPFALTEAAMDDWLDDADCDLNNGNETWRNASPWPGLYYGYGVAAGTLGVASAGLPSGWTMANLAANGYLAGSYTFWSYFYQAQHSSSSALALPIATSTTGSLYSLVQAMNFFQSYDFAGQNGDGTYRVTNLAPEIGIDAALTAIMFSANDLAAGYNVYYYCSSGAVGSTVDTDGDGLTDTAETDTYSTLPDNPDTDGDGVSDGAEVQLGRNPRSANAASTDSDGDGLSDLEEIDTYHTDPTSSDTDIDDDGLSNTLEKTTYGSNPAQPDSDGDGLRDGAEVEEGSSPTAVDTDGDGLGDGDEVLTYFTGPTSGDSDGDNLGDGTEINTWGTDPARADSDGDGENDWDYTHKDTDGDGLSDWSETHTHGTDPNDADSDDDGMNDGAEVAAGRDPLSPDPVEVTARYGTTAIFDHAPGNTYRPATGRVYVPKGVNIYTVRLTGLGHNQDNYGKIRVMEVKVNGSRYRVISWIPTGQTKSFNYTLPAGVLHNGWNDIEAYIHWGNDQYDGGHWVSVSLVLETKTIQVSGYGATTIFSNERGNSADKAYAQVVIPSSINPTNGKVTLSGWAKNMDANGYARVLRVHVNGTVLTPLTWISRGQTRSFSTTLNPALFHTGTNEVYAYIHWGNDTYDNGHRLELKVTITQ